MARLTSSLLAVVIGAPFSVTVTPSSAQVNEVEEIVVTARRREESLQEVPLSISAFSTTDIERRGITSIDDLAFEVPGLNFYSLSGGGLGAPIIRGLTKTNISGFENNVGVFFDNIFLDNNGILDTGFVDLERVEVAFGPQSALYGRNTFAGAISYVPRNPPEEFEFTGRGTVGTDEYFNAFVSVGGPIVEDRLKVLASIGYAENDGTIDNLYGGDNIGGYSKKQTIHTALEFNATDWLTFRGRYLGGDYHLDNEARYVIAGQPGFNVGGVANNCGTPTGPGGTLMTAYCGTIPGLDAAAADPRATGVENELDLLSALVEAQTRIATVTLQYGDVDTSAKGLTDRTLTPDQAALTLPGSRQALGFDVGNGFNQPFIGPVEENSWELRVLSLPQEEAGGLPIEWLFGAHRYDAHRQLDIRFFDERGAGGSLAETIRVERNEQIDEWSVFGRIAATFADRYTVSLEGRYTDEEKCGLNVADLTGLFGFPFVIETDFGCTTFTNFTPRVTLDIALTDDILLYGSWAKGTKTGGFNTNIIFVPGEDTFDEELNKTVEVGVKASWLDQRLTTNLAVYAIKWDDLQLTTASSNPMNTNFIILNVGEADSYGFEFTGNLQASENLDLNLGLSYGNPKYGSGNTDPGIAPLGFGTDISNKKLPRQSPFQVNASATYTVFGVLSAESGYGRIAVSHQSGQYAEALNLAKTESTTLVNLRLGLSYERFDVAVWAENLFDEEYVATALANLGTPSAEVGTRSTEVYLGQRRTIGLTGTIRF